MMIKMINIMITEMIIEMIKNYFLVFQSLALRVSLKPSQSMMACSYQPVLLTIEFIRMVGGGSTKERR